jgi:hypothetical protein
VLRRPRSLGQHVGPDRRDLVDVCGPEDPDRSEILRTGLAAMDEAVRLFTERGDLFMAARTLERLGRTEAAAGHQLPAITRLRWALALYRCLKLSHAEPVRSLIDDLLPRA